ncbi:hypothetical protein Spith_0618 [Spirochaeta thermophila DSM 6578]|uniref:Uncharacterized protein n=1 Tax=Winmispira thermophila (strain ATCC 700085 / DSM 6578 / Z-1203) TaxID=869211 RepID=G0GA62_WINT7|nr:hypothetical protein [Spirochaeta thermophila]AEJ60898.1 hypothetical protein Spith_0618 [Spirochaeta thermophila DSM 6578]
MRRALLLVLVLLLTLPLHGRDFPQSILTIHPFPAPYTSTILPHGTLRLWYETYTLEESPTDSFHIGISGAATPLAWHNLLALRIYFDSILVVGPLAPGDEAASVMEWWMNAVQYQYGALLGLRLPPLVLAAEYSRMSFHPLRWRIHDDLHLTDPATDRLGLLATTPPLTPLPWLTITPSLRAAYVDLFDYWQAEGLPEFREDAYLRAGLLLTSPVHRLIHPYLETWNDILFFPDGTGYAFRLETGLLIPSPAGELRLFLVVNSFSDTQEVEEGPFPMTTAGFGFAFIVASPGGR